MKRTHLFAALASLSMVAAGALAQPPKPPAPAKPAASPAKPVTAATPAPGPAEPLTITSGGKPNSFQVELAKATQGLAGRKDLAKDHGMLVDFQPARDADLSMKGVSIPLDMLFLDNDGTVLAIAENARPGSHRKITPGFPVSFVLEINAGLTKELGLKPGDKIQHRLFHTVTANG
jgi:uncharacterized protein